MADTERNIGSTEIDEMIEVVSDFRKATYEFARGQDPGDYDLMMDRQRRIFELFRAALASLPAEVDDRTPRPISTAPHDGTEVLAWSKTGKTWHQVYWKTQEHGNWLWEKPFPPSWACRWNSDYYQGQNEFSHWLPIPGAP